MHSLHLGRREATPPLEIPAGLLADAGASARASLTAMHFFSSRLGPFVRYRVTDEVNFDLANLRRVRLIMHFCWYTPITEIILVILIQIRLDHQARALELFLLKLLTRTYI